MRTFSIMKFVRSKLNIIRLVTARKRSLRQGNIFTSVCQEFCSRGRGGVPAPGGGGLLPGGLLVCHEVHLIMANFPPLKNPKVAHRYFT